MTPTKVDCSRMLSRMPIWKNFGMKSGEGGERDQQDEPDEVVEDEGEERLVALLPRLRRGGGHSTAVTGVLGGLRLPQNFGSSTLSLVMAAPGILMFGPQLSMVSSDWRPITS